jgi:hypothetical protein
MTQIAFESSREARNAHEKKKSFVLKCYRKLKV